MSVKKYTIVLILLIFLGITQFSSNFKSSELNIIEIPADFKYDGCSMFPDGNYGHCCQKHDEEYFFGGSWTQRLKSDKSLATCVARLGGYHTVLGPIMFVGVRVGGAPIFPTSFRWGFGRNLHIK